MPCLYGDEWYTCQSITGTKCTECIKHDSEIAKQKRKQIKFKARPDKRMGSKFEMKNHNANEALIHDVTNRMTPNSGAGKIKGDQEIKGIISVSEELKTKVAEETRGKKTFTIHKEWLDKLERESQDKEFYYLKFCFHENDDDVYVVVNQEIIMSMIKTMIEDRRKANSADHLIKIATLEKEKTLAENNLLRAKIALLEEKLNEPNGSI